MQFTLGKTPDGPISSNTIAYGTKDIPPDEEITDKKVTFLLKGQINKKSD